MALDRRLLRRAVTRVLRGAGVRKAIISVAVVDDDAMARLNWEYLRHRGPADVLSFLLDAGDPQAGAPLEGEVVVGAETAPAAPRPATDGRRATNCCCMLFTARCTWWHTTIARRGNAKKCGSGSGKFWRNWESSLDS